MTAAPAAAFLRILSNAAKLEFHDADTDILARILADTSDTRDFVKFLWQAERNDDILATILATMSARMSVSVSVSVSVSASWNASLTTAHDLVRHCQQWRRIVVEMYARTAS